MVRETWPSFAGPAADLPSVIGCVLARPRGWALPPTRLQRCAQSRLLCGGMAAHQSGAVSVVGTGMYWTQLVSLACLGSIPVRMTW